MECRIDGCHNKIKCKGLCQKHYREQYTPRKFEYPPVTADRIISETIFNKDFVCVPLYNIDREVVGYTKIDWDIYSAKFVGVKMHKSNYGYAVVGRMNFVHHQIIGKPDQRWIFVDHINRDRLDNRKENLRFVTPKGNSENSRNCIGGFGISGVKGIHYVDYPLCHKSPWRVILWSEKEWGKGKKSTKYFDTLENARSFWKEYYGK